MAAIPQATAYSEPASLARVSVDLGLPKTSWGAPAAVLIRTDARLSPGERPNAAARFYLDGTYSSGPCLQVVKFMGPATGLSDIRIRLTSPNSDVCRDRLKAILDQDLGESRESDDRVFGTPALRNVWSTSTLRAELLVIRDQTQTNLQLSLSAPSGSIFDQREFFTVKRRRP